MARFVLSPAADREIVSILAWTHQQFGEGARLRYEALPSQSILDVAEDPVRIGVIRRDEIREGAFTYHLCYSRTRVDTSEGRVRKPRHFLLFRLVDGVIEIGRVLLDSMEIDRHLPEGYQARELK